MDVGIFTNIKWYWCKTNVKDLQVYYILRTVHINGKIDKPEEILFEHPKGADNSALSSGSQLQQLHFRWHHPEIVALISFQWTDRGEKDMVSNHQSLLQRNSVNGNVLMF